MKRFYQSILYKVTLNVVFLLVLNSCVFGKKIFPPQIIGSRAPQEDFTVEKITKSSNSKEALTFNYDKDGIKESFTLHLQTCIKSKENPDISLQNHQFIIEYPDSLSNLDKEVLEQEEKFTNHEGCIQWEETYKYKYIYRSVWVGLNRVIRPAGENAAYSGQPEIPLAVNAWLEEGSPAPQILDMRPEYDKGSSILEDKYEENGLQFLSEMSKQTFFPYLWAPDITIQNSLNPSLAREYNPNLGIPEDGTCGQKELSKKGKGLDNFANIYLARSECLKEDRQRQVKEKCETPYNQSIEDIKKEYQSCLEDQSSQQNCLDQRRVPRSQSEQKRGECLKGLKEEHDKEVKALLETYQVPCTKDNLSQCYKRFLDLTVMIPLKIRKYDIYEDFSTEKLSGGAYDVNVQLVTNPYTDTDLFYRMHEERDEQNGRVCNKILKFRGESAQQNQFLLLRCTLKIPFFKENARYKLLMEIKPVEGSNLPFKAFQGVYTLNKDFIQSSENKKTRIDPETDIHYRDILGTDKEIDIFKQMKVRDILDSQKVKFSGFNVPRLEDTGEGAFKYSNIHTTEKCREHDNGVTRTVVFYGDICLQDKLSGEKYEDTFFRIFIEKPDENGEHFIEEVFPEDPDRPFYKTKGNGCIEKLPISLFNKIYIRQRYVRVKVHFLSEEHNLYARAEPALNPWQKQFQAYVDATELSDEDMVRFDVDGVEKPRLIINQFKSVNMFPSYGLDNLLNIHLYHRLYFLFQAFIQRLGDVAHGTFAMSREFMRDGYYLVRILLLRNPQETGHLRRVFHDWEIHERRKVLSLKNETIDFQDFKDAVYITHSDMIVKAEANFINLYTPLFITTRQLYYVSSRNIISIEIAPVDPNKFVYHEIEGTDGECILDEDATSWSPYFDHELVNRAFLGAFNLSSLTNWNILRPVKDFSSDEVIEKAIQSSKIKLEYKLFDLREEHQAKESQEEKKSTSPALRQAAKDPVGCIDKSNQIFWPYSFNRTFQSTEAMLQYVEDNEEIYKPSRSFSDVLGDDQQQIARVQGCFQSNLQFTSREKEARREEMENKNSSYGTEDVLKSFADKNALKVVDLSGNEGDKFKGDIQKALSILKEERGHEELQSKMLNPSDILLIIPENLKTSFTEGSIYKTDRQYLEAQIKEQCTADSVYDFAVKEDLCLHFSASKKYTPPTSDQLRTMGFKDHNEYIEAMKTCSGQDIAEGGISQTVQSVVYGMQQFVQQDVHSEPDVDSTLPKNTCSSNIIRDYINIVRKDLGSINYIGNSATLEAQMRSIREALRNIDKIAGERPPLVEELTHPTLREIIDGRWIYKEGQDEVYSFTQSLCRFWFDSFLPEYVESKQVLSAFTNYITKFDYYKVLESEAPKSHNEMLDISTQFSQAIGLKRQEGLPQEGTLYSCHERYKQCILSDHCLPRTFAEKNKTEYCGIYLNQEDESCIQLVEEECGKDSSFPLCPSKAECENDSDSPLCPSRKERSRLYHAFQKNCNKAVHNFCHTNVSHQLCDKFSGRCLANFKSCMKDQDITWLFNPNNILSDKLNKKRNPVLEACLKDPYQFFNFENKLVVYELSRNHPFYDAGFLRNISITGNYSSGNTNTWSGGHGHSLPLGVQLEWGGSLGFMRRLGGIFGPDRKSGNPVEKRRSSLDIARFGGSLRVAANETISSDASYGTRRSSDARVSVSLFTTVGNVQIQMDVKKFRKCLVIKPNPSAFYKHNFENANLLKNNWLKDSKTTEFKENNIWTTIAMNQDFRKMFVTRPGLVICNPLKDEQMETITENYYYVSQSTENNSLKFLNMSDLANRPFIIVLRGKKRFRRYYHMMKVMMEGDNGDVIQNGNLYEPPENMFLNYSFPVEEARGLSLAIREFKETGFDPGIYDYGEKADEELDIIIKQSRGLMNGVFDFFRKNVRFMNTPQYSEEELPNREYQ